MVKTFLYICVLALCVTLLLQYWPSPSPKPIDHVTREELGRATWWLWHQAARLREIDNDQMQHIVDGSMMFYGCEDCKSHFRPWRKNHPITKQTSLEQWTLEAHNHVNHQLGRPSYTTWDLLENNWDAQARHKVERYGWVVLHTAAAHYPIIPTLQQQHILKRWIMLVARVLGSICPLGQQLTEAILDSTPPTSSREPLIRYLHGLHDRLRPSQPSFALTSYISRWSLDGCKDCDATGTR